MHNKKPPINSSKKPNKSSQLPSSTGRKTTHQAPPFLKKHVLFFIYVYSENVQTNPQLWQMSSDTGKTHLMQ